MPNSHKKFAWYLISIEGAQLKKRVNIQVCPIEEAQNIGGRKQFHISIKRERLDEGVFMKNKSKHNKNVVFSPTCYKRASTVDEIINLSEVKDQEPTPHLGCTLDDIGWSEIWL